MNDILTADWSCEVCPFTGNGEAAIGHESGRDWMGDGQYHRMVPMASADRCKRAETSRDCGMGHKWVGGHAYMMSGPIAVTRSDILVCSGHADLRTDSLI